MKFFHKIPLLVAFSIVSPLALAQESGAERKLTIELNNAVTQQGACTTTFMVTNGLENQIESAVFETVLFDQSGQVSQLSLFDFGTLPPARPRVRQFVFEKQPCENIGQILFNGASECTGEGIDVKICDMNMAPSSRAQGVRVAG